MFADDITVNCVSDTAEKSIAQLNSALCELNEWCLINRLTPHPSKSEAMLISRRYPPANIRHWKLYNWMGNEITITGNDSRETDLDSAYAGTQKYIR